VARRASALVVHRLATSRAKPILAPICEFAQAVAPGLRHACRVVEPACRSAASALSAPWRPTARFQRIDRDDIAGTFPDRAEMGVTQQPRGCEFLDVADAAAHLQRIRRRPCARRGWRGISASGSGCATAPAAVPGCRPRPLSSASAVRKTHRQRLFGGEHDPSSIAAAPAAGRWMRLPNTTRFPGHRHGVRDRRGASARVDLRPLDSRDEFGPSRPIWTNRDRVFPTA